MSEELKRKLYNYDADPPEIVWNRIAAALDQEINDEFPRKLYDLEVKPPDNVWNEIEGNLQEVSKEQYSARLYNIEVIPPARSWDKISNLLDAEKTLPRIPRKGKIVSFVRYIAAACIVGVLAFGAFKLLNQKTSEEPVAVKAVSPPKDSARNQNATQLTPPQSNNLPAEGQNLARVETKSRKKNLPDQATYMTQTAANFPMPAGLKESTSDFRQASLTGEIPGNCSQISEADPYITFVNPDGYLIRISKKLAETLGCVYTTGNSQNYDRCQDQIKKWRDKIAQSPATSSPDNFMDILNVIKSVQE